MKAGALDGLWPGVSKEEARAAALDSLEAVLGRQSRLKEDMLAGQELLFGAQADEPAPLKNGVQSRRLSEHELLQFEKEVLGLYFSGHPLLRHRETLEAVSTHPIEALPKQEADVRVAGMINSVRKLVTKAKGETYARCSLEDLTGQIQVLVFPKAYAEGLGKNLVAEAIVAVRGRLSFRNEGDEPELIADEIDLIDKAVERCGKRLTLQLEAAGLEKDKLQELHKIFAGHKGPCPVTLSVHTPAHGTALIDTQEKVRLTPELFQELRAAMGERAWNIETAALTPLPKKDFRRR